HAKTAVLALPVLERLVADPESPAELARARTCRVLLEGSNNLLLCESALAHLSSFRLLQNAEDCNLEWTSFRGAGQCEYGCCHLGGRSVCEVTSLSARNPACTIG